MKPSSAKAKGRELQQIMRDRLRELGAKYGLEPEDCESRGMGQNGVDVILTPAAMRVFPLDIEAKNMESLNVVKIFWEHYKKYESRNTIKLLVHKKNRTRPLVTITLDTFMKLLEVFVKSQQKSEQPQQ